MSSALFFFALRGIDPDIGTGRFFRTLDFDPVVLDIVAEMAKLPGTLKAWRTQVAEAFQDNRFFNCTPATSEKWRPLIFALMSSDKERFTELLGGCRELCSRLENIALTCGSPPWLGSARLVR